MMSLFLYPPSVLGSLNDKRFLSETLFRHVPPRLLYQRKYLIFLSELYFMAFQFSISLSSHDCIALRSFSSSFLSHNLFLALSWLFLVNLLLITKLSVVYYLSLIDFFMILLALFILFFFWLPFLHIFLYLVRIKHRVPKLLRYSIIFTSNEKLWPFKKYCL